MYLRTVFDRAPRRVYWEVTRACDLVCRHCRAEAVSRRHPAELSTTEGVELLERLAAFGSPLPQVVLTGGDPLKRADLFTLIEAARALGFGVSVAPSATPLVTPESIGRLKAVGVEAISLSIDGATAQQHDALRGVSGTFERTIATAHVAAALGLRFQINTLVSEETLVDLPAIHRLVADLGAARWSLFFLVPVGRGVLLRPISPDACERLFHWLADLALHAGPVVTTTEAPHFRRVVSARKRDAARLAESHPRHASGHGAGIRDGNGIMFISHTGEVQPSGFLPLVAGNVRTEDPVAIYRESAIFCALRQADRFGGRCGRCEYRWECGGSRARAYAASGDPLGEDPLCRYEPGPSPGGLQSRGGDGGTR